MDKILIFGPNLGQILIYDGSFWSLSNSLWTLRNTLWTLTDTLWTLTDTLWTLGDTDILNAISTASGA